MSRSLAYLVGETFLNFIEAAEEDADYGSELPAFAATIKRLFEPWQQDEYLATARQSQPFGPSLNDNLPSAEIERRLELRRSAAELLLVERARE